MKNIIFTKDLLVGYESNIVVKELNISIPRQKITAIVGGNGSGKSTILKTLARILKPSAGAAYLDGNEIHSQKTKEVAKRMAILPQNPLAPDGLTVLDLVCYGRAPHQGNFGTLTKKDLRIVIWALGVTQMEEFADRALDYLSGGQRQRAWIAMALAQETEIFLLDEPTSFLDISHQYEVLSLLKYLNEYQKRTIIMVVHDLNHASRYAHNIIAIKNGQAVYEGTPQTVITSQMVKNIFGIDADILTDPRGNVPICLPFFNDNTYHSMAEEMHKREFLPVSI